ncbi:MAG: hypothetical protein V4580_01130 [Bacteroidota bacterium]
MKRFQTIFYCFTIGILTTMLCAFSKDDDGKKVDVDPMTYYYLGEIKITTPDSIPMGTYVALSKQIVHKKESKITMQSISIDQKGDTKEYNYTMNISDPTYTIRDVDSTYSGTGKLHGKAWKWLSWNYDIQYKNPVGRMKGKDFVSLWGLMVNKDFYGADGKKLLHYHERHNFITKQQFEILYLQVLKGSSK